MGKLIAVVTLVVGMIAAINITTEPWDFHEAHVKREAQGIWTNLQKVDVGKLDDIGRECDGDRYYDHHAEFSCQIFGLPGRRMLTVTIYDGEKIGEHHVHPILVLYKTDEEERIETM